ncbi:hypothetical protein F7725_008986 [Dissostichus mawsoni]|uniref:Uncharacterized protein n=1 Tax=Dissostichus mawsoni TaxID=36200 RepID=A0A7J5Z8U6_DISMA|nr:hypothetical protein F7725_008986 [Dissostichus mawsoni]
MMPRYSVRMYLHRLINDGLFNSVRMYLHRRESPFFSTRGQELGGLEDVYGGLPQPDGGQLQAVLPGIKAPQSYRAPLGQPLHLPEPPSRVVLHEPSETQNLDQHGGHQHEEEREAEPEVVLPLVVLHGEAQVRAHVPEEDQEGQDDPEAVHPQLLPGGTVGLADPDPPWSLADKGPEARGSAAPVARGGAAAHADVNGCGVQVVFRVHVVQLREAAAPAACGSGFSAVRLRGHVPLPALLRNARQPPRGEQRRNTLRSSSSSIIPAASSRPARGTRFCEELGIMLRLKPDGKEARFESKDLSRFGATKVENVLRDTASVGRRYDRLRWEFGGVRHAAANSLTLKAMKCIRLYNLLPCKYFHTDETLQG